MLQADKDLVEASTEVKLLSIRERELALYLRNTNLLGTVSAIIAGMGYFGLVYVKMQYFRASGEIAKATYVLGLTMSMSLAMRNLLGTTTIAVLGPGMALRGNMGAMHKAIDGMMIELETITNVLHQSMYCFMGTLIAYAWGAASPHWICSVLLTALALVTAWLIAWSTGKVEATFPVRTMKLTSGTFYTEVLKRRKQVQELLKRRAIPAETVSERPCDPPKKGKKAKRAGERGMEASSATAAALKPKASVKMIPYHSERMKDSYDIDGPSHADYRQPPGGRGTDEGMRELM
mmetsp:Transcript_20136/g.51270  ORF Transcript_20136/g.51270 Transcript_20136/m.51270 type:complete len:292 (+) Transcript_20136:57-932(+)